MKNNKSEIEEECGIPITEKDVTHSDWIQEIKDKVISPIEEGTLKYSLIGLWDLCGNIDNFVKEKCKEAEQSGLLKAKEIIEAEETEIPDDDGVPAQISSEVFKRVILQKLGEIKNEK